MDTKKVVSLIFVAAIGIGIFGLMIGSRKAEVKVASNPARPRPAARAPVVTEVTEPAPPPEPPEPPVINSLPPAAQARNSEAKPAAQTQQPPIQNGQPPKLKAPIQDPAARAALSLVGVEPEAGLYWVSAINDPTLPAEERKDLIEDLNEDGLSDPQHPAPEDMPVILNRIQLIEQLAPDSMDQVNAAAFAEAYKDLVNLAKGRPAD